jgi:hypothetical protein
MDHYGGHRGATYASVTRGRDKSAAERMEIDAAMPHSCLPVMNPKRPPIVAATLGRAMFRSLPSRPGPGSGNRKASDALLLQRRDTMAARAGLTGSRRTPARVFACRTRNHPPEQSATVSFVYFLDKHAGQCRDAHGVRQFRASVAHHQRRNHSLFNMTGSIVVE